MSKRERERERERGWRERRRGERKGEHITTGKNNKQTNEQNMF